MKHIKINEALEPKAVFEDNNDLMVVIVDELPEDYDNCNKVITKPDSLKAVPPEQALELFIKISVVNYIRENLPNNPDADITVFRGKVIKFTGRAYLLDNGYLFISCSLSGLTPVVFSSTEERNTVIH